MDGIILIDSIELSLSLGEYSVGIQRRHTARDLAHAVHDELIQAERTLGVHRRRDGRVVVGTRELGRQEDCNRERRANHVGVATGGKYGQN